MRDVSEGRWDRRGKVGGLFVWPCVTISPSNIPKHPHTETNTLHTLIHTHNTDTKHTQPGTHTPKQVNFACMAVHPLAVAMVARLRVIPVFGGDLTLGRAN